MRSLLTHFVTVMALFMPLQATAGLIRDAEIESTLRAYADPVFEVAGIPPEDVRMFIVANPTLNAYVAGGLNIFMHTGLLAASTAPGEIIGVIAHETGHIEGAHLSQLREKSSRAILGAAIGAVLGAATAVGGGGRVAGGILMGTQQSAQGIFAGQIRINENSADQAALKYLDALDISASGMLSMFETLRRKQGIGNDILYLRTHPLTTDRISAMRNHIEHSDIPIDQVPDGFKERHARMIAKLMAFTEPYATTLASYPPSDTSIAARYARAIADYRHQKLESALQSIDALIKEFPKDPYFYDTKGQMLFENGRLKEAAASYARASTLKPDSALILTDYAKTLIAQNNPRELPRAVALLERSRDLDDSYATTWRQLAIAYGKQGRLGLSYMALAEESALEGDYKTVLQHVTRARESTRGDRSLSLVIDDIERDAKEQMRRKEKEDALFIHHNH